MIMLAERDLQLGADLPADIARDLKSTDAEYDRVSAALARDGAADKAAADRLAGRLRELRDTRERLVRRVRQQSPRFGALQYPESLDLAAVRDTLEPGTALLVYWVAEGRTLLFALRPASTGDASNGLTVIPIDVTERDLRARVKEMRDALQARAAPPQTRAVGGLAGARAKDGVGAISTRLYDLLVRPAEKAIQGSERLLIVPDGPLHALPFGALTVPARGSRRARYLVESTAVHVAASATLHNEARRMRPEMPVATAAHLVAFGDPDFGSVGRASATRGPAASDGVAERGFKLAPLPMARREVQAIAKLFATKSSVYIGPEATEARAKSIPASATHVHFASHAVLDERLPLNSALLLAPSPGSGDQPSDNGLLQVWEIFEGTPANLDLVTLSACETALGEEFGGEGLLGLTQAFQYAGARSVVASLWSIPDASTSQLMLRFYRYMRAGRSKDEALRAAQIDAIRSAGAYSHPFHWAAFQLFGDRR
jgi:CHAT domain-containing protein